jgi:hypothetical protein
MTRALLAYGCTVASVTASATVWVAVIAIAPGGSDRCLVAAAALTVAVIVCALMAFVFERRKAPAFTALLLSSSFPAAVTVWISSIEPGAFS